MTKDLFRKEAIRHRTRALYGDVVLAAPLSTWVITGLLIAVIGGAVAFGVLTHVESENGTIPLWRWIFGRAI